MSSLSLPKNTDVLVRTKDFSELIAHLKHTIETHLQFIEDDNETVKVWSEFKFNGIGDSSLHTINAVAHMLNMTPSTEYTMGGVIEQFFSVLPVLKQ